MVADFAATVFARWIEIKIIVLPHELLGRVSNRIINEVRSINRVVYDISGKPASTIKREYFLFENLKIKLCF